MFVQQNCYPAILVRFHSYIFLSADQQLVDRNQWLDDLPSVHVKKDFNSDIKEQFKKILVIKGNWIKKLSPFLNLCVIKFFNLRSFIDNTKIQCPPMTSLEGKFKDFDSLSET